MNRGVEIDPAIADGPRSVINEQVEMGVAVRMAVLDALLADRAGTSMTRPLRHRECPHRRSRLAAPTRNGAVLVEDGKIAEASPTGAPAGRARRRRGLSTPRGLVVAPGLIDMRVFTGEPGHEYRETLAIGRRCRCGRRRHQLRADARHRAGRRRRRARRFPDPPRHGDGQGQRPARRRPSPRASRGEEITEFGLLQGSRRRLPHRWPPFDPVDRPAARRHELCAPISTCRSSTTSSDALAGRRRRDERGRARHHSRASRAFPREAETIPLARDLQLAALTGVRYHAAQISTGRLGRAAGRRQAADGTVTRRHLDQQSLAQRERRRALPHLLQALAAAALRGRPPGGDRGPASPAPSTSSIPTTIRRTPRSSASPSPKPPRAPSASKPCSPPRCASSIPAMCRC